MFRSIAAAVWLCAFLVLDASAETVDGHLRSPASLLRAPCPSADSLMLDKLFFTICYHAEWRIPRWVAYHLIAGDLGREVAHAPTYEEDRAIRPAVLRSSRGDYAGTGYRLGQMAPADSFDRSVAALAATFLLSNAAPQTPSLNGGLWRDLEGWVRLIARNHRGIWVVTGNLFAEEWRDVGTPDRQLRAIDPFDRIKDDKRHWIGGGRVAVPTHGFKALLVARDSGDLTAYGFVMPNQRRRLPGDVGDYLLPVDLIEDLTGLDLFAALDDRVEDDLEAATAAWPPKRERRQ